MKLAIFGGVSSWQHWTDLLPAPTNSKPNIGYQPTTQSTPVCRISPQNKPCTAERIPTPHQERTHSKVCRGYCPDSDETVEHFLFHCPLYDNIRFRLLPAQPNIHNTQYGSTTQLQRTATYTMSAMNRRDKIVRRLGDQER